MKISKTNYRKSIKKILEELPPSEKLSLTKLSEKTRIPRLYLSQALQEKKHFSSDQIYSICEVLQLPSKISKLLILIKDFETTKVRNRKKQLKDKINSVTIKSAITTETEIPKIDTYFSIPEVFIAHCFLQIETFRKNPEALRLKMGLGLHRWKYILEILESTMCIKIDGEITLISKPYIPPYGSPFAKSFHIAGRTRVANGKLQQTNIDDFMYNWWFVADEKQILAIKKEFLQLASEIYEGSKEVEHDKIYQLNFDFLRV